MRRLNLAYEVLRDPAKRAAYDRQRARQGPSRPMRPTSESPVRRPAHTQRPTDSSPVGSDRRATRASTYKTPISILLFVLVAVAGVLYSIVGGGEAADGPTQSSSNQPGPPVQTLQPRFSIPTPKRVVRAQTAVAAPDFGRAALATAVVHLPTTADASATSPNSALADAIIKTMFAPLTPAEPAGKHSEPAATSVPTPSAVPTTTSVASIGAEGALVEFPYTGIGDRNTPQFEVNSPAWKLLYRADWDGHLNISVEGDTVVSRQTESGETYETFVYGHQGVMYLSVDGGPPSGRWTVWIDDGPETLTTPETPPTSTSTATPIPLPTWRSGPIAERWTVSGPPSPIIPTSRAGTPRWANGPPPGAPRRSSKSCAKRPPPERPRPRRRRMRAP